MNEEPIVTNDKFKKKYIYIWLTEILITCLERTYCERYNLSPKNMQYDELVFQNSHMKLQLVQVLVGCAIVWVSLIILLILGCGHLV